jgi:hypothetical protein
VITNYKANLNKGKVGKEEFNGKMTIAIEH